VQYELTAHAIHIPRFRQAHSFCAPPLQLTVLTCMDSRLIPERFLGLDIGDAEIIRNGGGRVTLDVLR
jgi:carbonic anhydrase